MRTEAHRFGDVGDASLGLAEQRVNRAAKAERASEIGAERDRALYYRTVLCSMEEPVAEYPRSSGKFGAWGPGRPT